jgi:aminoglycoside phosphotransferase (APT) family kinase protein
MRQAPAEDDDPGRALAEGLTTFLEAELGRGAEPQVSDVAPVASIGNAREPWSFTARWRTPDGDERVERCVMLIKAEAGQLDTALGPELHTIAALAGSGVPVPRALWLDDEGRWLGRPFFVTAFVPGTASMRPLRVPDGVPEIRAVGLDLARAAARLHAVDWQARGLDAHLEPVGVGDVAMRELAAWERQFERQRLEPHPALAYAFAWLRRRAPVAERIGIVHGDLRFGNVLYEGHRLTALLDWEMVHLGDPVEDLGWVYRRIWTPERSLPFEEFLAAYEEEAGRRVEPDHLRWYQAFAEVKHSVISLHGARSFHDRRTANLRHADRAETVPAFLGRFFELVA